MPLIESTSIRADQLLVVQGLARSRAEATNLIRAGQVKIGITLVRKPSQLLTPDVVLKVSQTRNQPLTRAAEKITVAISELRTKGYEPNIKEQLCLDVGASTGGFTSVLLAEGARKVIALDVGHGQLLPEIAADTRVIVMEGVNARNLNPAQLPFAPTFITCDVSFISLKLVFPALAAVTAPKAQILTLVKPQFEVGKGQLGKGGVVRNQLLIEKVLEEVQTAAADSGITPVEIFPSAVLGTHGNQEFFLYGKLQSSKSRSD